ncbi:hypothetical protein [Metabacillus arenae]|uniref:IDEAL domain-containing protein n=1 Tax=Metabacillus arenae TaxID=2771434 RepID=A0A926RZP4_9BACI|nr:hypothetical protein [Metabacillus arenae]MBD1383030.1 hypothetical protein [Metabacillus arenae]
MEYNMRNVKDFNSPILTSKDYLELMHMALHMDDKEWFDELAAKKEVIDGILDSTC